MHDLHGKSQYYTGQMPLLSVDQELCLDINSFNEKYYQRGWRQTNHEQVDAILEELKQKALQELIPRMRNDIEKSSRLTLADCIFSKKRHTK